MFSKINLDLYVGVNLSFTSIIILQSVTRLSNQNTTQTLTNNQYIIKNFLWIKKRKEFFHANYKTESIKRCNNV